MFSATQAPMVATQASRCVFPHFTSSSCLRSHTAPLHARLPQRVWDDYRIGAADALLLLPFRAAVSRVSALTCLHWTSQTRRQAACSFSTTLTPRPSLHSAWRASSATARRVRLYPGQFTRDPQSSPPLGLRTACRTSPPSCSPRRRSASRARRSVCPRLLAAPAAAALSSQWL